MSDDAPLEPIPPAPPAPGAGAPSAPTETGTQTQVPPAASASPTPPAAAEGTAEMPTQPAEPVPASTPPGPPPWGTPPGGAGTPGAPRSSTVAVPKWVLLTVGALLIALLGFGVGYAAAPGGDDGSDAATRVVPGPFGGNDGNGNGNGEDIPTIPLPNERQADPSAGFLGVVSTRSTDPDGARITRVVEDSPAAEAGLEEGDVITKVDDDAITTPAELADEIQDEDAGDTVTITYVRDGDTKTTDVELVSRRDGLRLSTPSTTVPGQ